MILTIELSSQEEGRLISAARLKGLDPAEFARKLVTEHLPLVTSTAPDEENQALIDLLRSWSDEDATEDPQELRRRNIETEQFLSHIESNRLTIGSPEP